MAGVDNIVNEILQQGQAKADELIAEARAKADEILQKSAEADEKMKLSSEQNTQRRVKDLAERAKSQSSLQKRQTVLKARQEIIDGVIEKAYLKLSTQGDEDYFSMAEKLVEKTARAGDGIICFNAEDLKRVPADFAQRIEKIARSKGGTLKISDKGAKIRSGFILSYGGIEENCTLDSIFTEKRDELRDLVNSILW